MYHASVYNEEERFIKLTYVDVGQSPLQFSVRISDISVAVKNEIRK